MTGATAKISAAALTGIILALAFLGVASRSPQPASANHLIEIGVDTDTTGNGPSILGTNESCRSVTNGTTFTIDIWGKDMDALIGFSTYLSYNGSVVNVVGNNVSQRLSAGGGSNVFDSSEKPNGAVVSTTNPDTDGIFRAEATDIADASIVTAYPDGSGVLARVTLKAVGAGISTAAISPRDIDGNGSIDIGPILADHFGGYPGDAVAPFNGMFDRTITDATIAVDQPDQDGDGIQDPCDPDVDGDTVPNATDNCPTVSNPSQADTDGDGLGDACEQDTDNDGLDNAADPCPTNPDCDGDTVVDGLDNCVTVANPGQQNLDGDPEGDACDKDDDADGYPDTRETSRGSDPMSASSKPEVCDGINNDGDGQTDEGHDFNSNGIPDCSDAGQDTDGDGIANPSDSDCDNDGKPNTTENWVGTHSCKYCPSSTSDEAWWADMDNNKFINILDVLKFRNPFFATAGQPKFEYRVDLVPNGVINILDVVALKTPFGTGC